MLKVRKAFSQLQEGIDKIVCYFLDPKNLLAHHMHNLGQSSIKKRNKSSLREHPLMTSRKFGPLRTLPPPFVIFLYI